MYPALSSNKLEEWVYAMSSANKRSKRIQISANHRRISNILQCDHLFRVMPVSFCGHRKLEIRDWWPSGARGRRAQFGTAVDCQATMRQLPLAFTQTLV